MRLRDGLTAGMPDHFPMPEEFFELADWSQKMEFVVGNLGHIAEPDIHETADARLLGTTNASVAREVPAVE